MIGGGPAGRGQPRGRRLRGLVAALAGLALGAAGCRWPAKSGAPADAGQRWIENAPSDELLVAQLQGIDCVVASSLPGGAVPAGMRIDGGVQPIAAGGDGITLIGWQSPPRLRIGRPFAPGEIDAARFTIAGLRRGSARLRWFSPGGTEPAGTLELSRAQGGGTLRDHFYFDLAHRLPADRPVELEAELSSVPGEIVTLSELCIGRARLDAERLRVISRVAWKATLADETRDVLIQPPTGELSRSLVLPRAARLTVGFGRLAGLSQRVRLEVRTEAVGEASRVLLDRLLEAGELAAGWVDLDVDLAVLGAGERRLVLAAAPEPDADPTFVAAWSAPRIATSAGRQARPNIVLISLDTLRADHLSLYGYGRATSPRLDAWARERRAAVFRQVVPSSGWTLPSHFSLFTGLHAFRHPANHDSVAIDASAFSFLAERLLAAGYRTQAFTGGGFVHPVYGLAKGFEGFSYWSSPERRPEELAANLVRAGKWLDRLAPAGGESPGGDDPFLLFLHTYEIHAPYTARQPYFGNFSRLPANLIVDFIADRDRVPRGFLGTFHIETRSTPEAAGEPLAQALAELPADLYDSKIGYVDALLAPLLRRLSEPPFAANTVVVIFSDHGESLGDGGRASHANLALDNLLVPLIVVTPGASQAREIPSQVRLIDLYPTLLELAGLEVPGGIDGQSLSALLAGGAEPEGRPAWAYGASTNWGLSLLAPGGLKLDWRNSPWKPIAGNLLWSSRDGFKETMLPAAPATPEADRMVRQIQQVYARDGNGLRFELHNRSPQAVRVAITSDLVDPVAVKRPMVDGMQLEWGHMGSMSAEVAAGASLALRFERTERREIELQIGIGTERCGSEITTTAVAASAEQLRQPLRRHLDLPACAGAGEPSAAGGLELEIAWQGPLPAAKSARPDDGLRQDLQALGYLN